MTKHVDIDTRSLEVLLVDRPDKGLIRYDKLQLREVIIYTCSTLANKPVNILKPCLIKPPCICWTCIPLRSSLTGATQQQAAGFRLVDPNRKHWCAFSSLAPPAIVPTCTDCYIVTGPLCLHHSGFVLLNFHSLLIPTHLAHITITMKFREQNLYSSKLW